MQRLSLVARSLVARPRARSAPSLPRFFSSSAAAAAAAPSPPQRVTHTDDQLAAFDRDGYLRVPAFFTADECRLLRDTVEADAAVQEQVMPMADTSGRESKLTLWFNLGDDTYSAFARSRSLVDAARRLISAPHCDGRTVEPYMFHTKIMLKEPRKGGAWEWHQDFGYWYAQGLLQPDRCFSCIMAMDNHTRANGCLQVLRGSHKLGRVEHGIYGDQAGVDPERLKVAQELYELVHCELTAGDMLFTHSNLLHASAPNNSDDWRRSMIIAYNGEDNGPLADSIIPPFNAIDPVLEDDELASFGVVPHSADRSDFLSAEANKDSFDQEIKN